MKNEKPGRLRPSAALWRIGALAAGVAMLAGMPARAAEEGTFPTADQVGGQVFPKGLQKGDVFPTQFKLFDEKGKELTFGDALAGKRTLIVFFISAAPASIAELKKIDAFIAQTKPDLQVIFANADTVGVALDGGKSKAIPETVRTVSLVKRENALTNPVFVAPNNVFDPKGLSNQLGFRGLPTSYLIGADGKVEKQFVGVRDWNAGDL